MEWEILIRAAETSNEVVLEGSDSAFGSIAPMETGWDELKVDFFRGEKLFEGRGTFVVEALELRSVTAGNKSGVNVFVCL